jgi:hypothetical protein
MNPGPFGLLAIAVGVAALFCSGLVTRNLITGRPAATHLKEWFLCLLGAAPLIVAFVGLYLYAKHKGIDEHTTLKWMNILITAGIVLGLGAKQFWRLRTK